MLEGLIELGFKQTKIDQCIFIKDDVIIFIYVDDCVMIFKNDKKITKTMAELRKKYTITYEGNMEEYIGIQLEYSEDSIRMFQPLLIERFINIFPGMKNTNQVNYPALPSVIFTKYEQGAARNEKFNYGSFFGTLNFLTNSSHPELAYLVHQCDHFYNDPKLIRE